MTLVRNPVGQLRTSLLLQPPLRKRAPHPWSGPKRSQPRHHHRCKLYLLRATTEISRQHPLSEMEHRIDCICRTTPLESRTHHLYIPISDIPISDVPLPAPLKVASRLRLSSYNFIVENRFLM